MSPPPPTFKNDALLTILLKYRTHFTLNNVLKILVDTSSQVLSLVGKRAKAVLPETFLRRKPFMLKTSELNWVRLRPVRDTWSSSLKTIYMYIVKVNSRILFFKATLCIL